MPPEHPINKNNSDTQLPPPTTTTSKPPTRKTSAYYQPYDISKSYRQVPLRRPTHNRITRAATHYNLQLINNVLDPTTGQQQNYKQLIAPNSPTHDIRLHSMGNEIGRLAQGMPTRVQGTDTIFFIPKHKIPLGRKVTYARIVPAIRPQKDETHCTRMTVGGNLLQYDQDTGSPAADLVTAKLFFNIIISTPRARFMNMDVKDFYLNNNMPCYEYMKIHISLLPKDVINHYHLQNIQDEQGYVYMEIRKGMYGLKQAGRIAYDALVKHLAKYSYVPSNTTQGLWTHVTRPIQFILVVDDFGVKYTNEEDVHHLIAALKDKYNISIDWEGSLYCDIDALRR